MLTLRRPYPRVRKDGRLMYGGSQMLANNALIRGCGCGPVAALDLLHYLCDDENTPPLPIDRYNAELESLCRSYFPLIPHSGINGLMLALGCNRLFRRRHRIGDPEHPRARASFAPKHHHELHHLPGTL